MPAPLGPHVTIVMATRNGGRHLAEQLESLARQSYRNWSLFVSDDGSCDATHDLLRAFARDYPVTFVSGPKQGAAQNFLSALCHPQLATGWIALADQDDVWLRGKLARAMRRMETHLSPAPQRPALYASESILTDAALRPQTVSTSGGARPSFTASLAQNLFAGHAMVFNPAAHQILRRAGRPVEVHWHDWWIYQILAGAGAQLIHDPLPTTLYRQHSHNALGASFGLLSKVARVQQVLNGAWGTVMRQHAEALHSRSHLLTPRCAAQLARFRAAPPWGQARLRTFENLGIRRSHASENTLLRAGAWLGRV